MPLSKVERTEFRLSVSARETPRALAVVGVCFVAITAANAAVGEPMPLSTFLINGFVAATLFAGAAAVHRSWVQAKTTPWIAALCALAMISAGQVQVWLAPDGSAFAYVLLVVVAYSPLTLAWAPASLAAIPILAGCVVVSTQWPASEAIDWVIASSAAVLIGLVLMGLRLRSIDETGELTAQVEALATRDHLTGLLNRHGIWQLVPRLESHARRSHQSVFALFVDIVGLKQANDVSGHDAGDRIIRDVGAALRASLRDDDVIGRWGGDEFLVLGIGTPHDPDALAGRVREFLTHRAAPLGSDPVQISVGSAVVGVEELDMALLIERADHDMYSRRRGGRDT